MIQFSKTRAWLLLLPILITIRFCQVSVGQTEPGLVTIRNQEVIEKLEELHSASYMDKPFGEVLVELREQMECNIVLNHSAVENNLDNDTPVQISLDSVTRAQFLAILLEPYQCTYLIRDGVLTIASDDYAIEYPMLEVLNASELLQTIKPLTSTREIRTYRGGSGRAGGVFHIVDGEFSFPQQQGSVDNQLTNKTVASEPEPTFQLETNVVTPAQQLVELIEESVDPDSWEVNGGTCRMRELNGKLIIVQTAKNLREIKILLESLK